MLIDATRPETIASGGLSFSPRSGRTLMLDAGAEVEAAQGGRRVVDGVTGCAMLVSRDVFERVGLFEESYFFAFEDLDLCLRARAAGFSSAVVLDAVAYHHGSRSIGPRSPLRLYYAARNHLLLARRAAPRAGVAGALRALWIVALNLAFALRGVAAPRAAGVAAVLRGVGHHRIGRYGSAEPGAGAPARAVGGVTSAPSPPTRSGGVDAIADHAGQHPPTEPAAPAGRRA
jgi:GT2 family glycosyltransferase